jgi:hypothetical protein
VEKKFPRASGLEKTSSARLDRERSKRLLGRGGNIKIVFDGALKLIFTGVRF